MRHEWRVVSFDPSVPMTLSLVLEADDPLAAQLVEQAAAHWGVEIERVPELLVSWPHDDDLDEP